MTNEEQIAGIWSLRRSDALEALARSDGLLQNLHADLSPEDLLRLHAGRAVALSTLSRFDEAVEAVGIAEQLYASEGVHDRELEFELRRIRGRQAVMQQRQAEALRLTLKNLELMSSDSGSPLLALAHSDVAGAYGVAGNLRKALAHLQEGLRRTPESNHSHYGALLNNLGNVYMSLGRVAEAMACFARAQEAFRRDDNRMQVAVTVSNEGRALGILGQFDRASALLKDALVQFQALGLGHYEAATHYKLAGVLAQGGDAQAAEQQYLKAFERIDQGNADGYEDDARVAYGEFLKGQNRPQEAVEQFRLALTIVRRGGTEQKIATVLEHVASALEQAGAVNDALAAYKELMALRDVIDKDPARYGDEAELAELEVAVERDLDLLQVTARALVEANKLLAEQSRELTKLATTDHLTGLYNRRHFSQKLESAVSGSRRDDRAYSVMFLDVDSFKVINDTYGHSTGDIVLQELSRLFLATVRESDVVARWGGEEFAVLLTGADAESARQIADKLRTAVADFDWNSVASKLQVTVSAGVVGSADQPQASADDVMRLADELLYRAKSSGRNRTVWASNKLDDVKLN